MPPTKRKADGELASPPPKRRQEISPCSSLRSTPTPTPTPKPRPTTTCSASSSTILACPNSPESSHKSRPTSPSAFPTISVSESEVNEEAEALLERIQEGIEYEQKQREGGEAIKQTTRFEVATTPSPALTLLRRYATLVWASKTVEVHELGIPRPDWVTEGVIPGIHDPQWFGGKSLAEIKAGPYGEENDIKRAEAVLKGVQTRRNKKKAPTAREKEIEWKLTEGLRRQENGLRMCEEEGSEDESESDRSTSNIGDSESEGNEDQIPVKRGGRRLAATALKRRAQSPESSDEPPPVKRRLRSVAANPMKSRVQPPESSENQPPIKRSARPMTTKTLKRRGPPVVDEMDSESDAPVRRQLRSTAGQPPRKRVRWVVVETESEDEDEEDIPILQDPRYFQYKQSRSNMVDQT